MADSSIADFYQGKSIFITGGTGFLGMVLLEKILCDCDGIKNIYLLIKPKNNKTIQQRLMDVVNSPAFQRIREGKPEAIKKIIPIQGNLFKSDIGLSDDDLSLLRKKVSVVFHVGADISFEMTVSEAVETNTKPTSVLLNICKTMPLLSAFVYVSTAYANCNKDVVDERVARSEIALETIYKLLNNPDKAGLFKNLIDGRPNTYAYSKSLAEDLIEQNYNGLPVAIVRPSIILSSAKEPVPGWMSGLSGPSGVLVAASKGMVKCWYSNPDTIFDVVPVDYVASLIIAAAWKTHCNWNMADTDLKVYTLASGLRNPIQFGKFIFLTIKYIKKYTGNTRTFTLFKLTGNYYLYTILVFIFQIIPWFLYDMLLFVRGQKLIMKNNAKKLRRLQDLFSYFCMKQFLFIDNNTHDLLESMTEDDRSLFDFDVRNINWDSYLEHYARALTKY